jgi:hypothetical protein
VTTYDEGERERERAKKKKKKKKKKAMKTIDDGSTMIILLISHSVSI